MGCKAAISNHELNASAFKKAWLMWSGLLFTALLGMSFGVCSLLASERMELIVPSAAILVVSVLRLKTTTPYKDDAERRYMLMVVAGIVCTAIVIAIELIGLLLNMGMQYSEALNRIVLLFLPLLCPSFVITVCFWIKCAIGLRSGESAVLQCDKWLPIVSAAMCFLWLLGMIYQYFAISPVSTTHTFHYPSCAAIGCAAIWYVKDHLDGCASLGLPRVNDNSNKVCSSEKGVGAALFCNENKAILLRSLEKTRLSDRELLVLALTLEGKTGKEIAQDIKVSTPTVGSYRSRGYEKIGVSNKKELFRLVEEAEKSDLDEVAGGKTIESSDAAMPSLSEGHERAIGKVGVTASIAMVIVIVIMISMLLFDPLNELLQSRYDTMVLVEYGPSIKAILSGLLLTSGFALIFTSGQPANASDLFRREMLPSSFERYVICLGVVCSSALVFASSYPYAIGRFFGSIGMVSSCAYMGAHVARTEKKGCSKLFASILMGYKAISAMCPELIVLAGTSAVTIDSVVAYGFSIWMGWPLARGVSELMFPLCMASVLALASMALINLMEHMPCVSLSLDERARAESYLAGRGLTDLQIKVLLLSLQGLSIPTICSRLHIAPGTVGSYRSRAYSILGVRTLKEAGDLIRRETRSRS